MYAPRILYIVSQLYCRGRRRRGGGQRFFFEHRRGDDAAVARVHTHLVGVFTLGSIDCAAVCERVRANVGKNGSGRGFVRGALGSRTALRRAIPRRPIADDDDDDDNAD